MQCGQAQRCSPARALSQGTCACLHAASCPPPLPTDATPAHPHPLPAAEQEYHDLELDVYNELIRF